MGAANIHDALYLDCSKGRDEPNERPEFLVPQLHDLADLEQFNEIAGDRNMKSKSSNAKRKTSTAKKSSAKPSAKSSTKSFAKSASKASAKFSAKSRRAPERSDDVVTMILRDHKPIKELLTILKDGEAPISEKRTAFKEFEPLLSSHAKAEEKSLYNFLKESNETRVEALEGDSEHEIADRLIMELSEISEDDDLWMAKVKVLAEVVDHHIKEEEKEVLKETIKDLSASDRSEIGLEYTRLLGKYRGDRTSSNSKTKNEEQRAEHA